MAIQITAPLSTYVDRTKPITVTWSNTDSIYNGHQTSYEIQYRLPSSSSWSTLGTVTSSTSSATLNGIFDKVEEDAEEYYYRIVVKYSNFDAKSTSLGGMASGTDYSDIYSIAFHGSQIGTMKIFDGTDINNYPIYDTVTGTKSKLNVNVNDSQSGAIPLVSSTSLFAGRDKVNVNTNNVRNIAASPASSFTNKRGNSEGYFTVYRYQYYVNYAYTHYTNYSRDRSYANYSRDRSYANYARDRSYANYARDRSYANYARDRSYANYARDRSYANYARDRSYANYARDRSYSYISSYSYTNYRYITEYFRRWHNGGTYNQKGYTIIGSDHATDPGCGWYAYFSDFYYISSRTYYISYYTRYYYYYISSYSYYISYYTKYYNYRAAYYVRYGTLGLRYYYVRAYYFYSTRAIYARRTNYSSRYYGKPIYTFRNNYSSYMVRDGSYRYYVGYAAYATGSTKNTHYSYQYYTYVRSYTYYTYISSYTYYTYIRSYTYYTYISSYTYYTYINSYTYYTYISSYTYYNYISSYTYYSYISSYTHYQYISGYTDTSYRYNYTKYS